MLEEHWKRFVVIQQSVKQVTLLAEELGDDFTTTIQVWNEQRHVIDHTTRAMASQLSIGTVYDAAYIEGNFEKAIAHSYRAFFDAADHLSLHIRTKIRQLISPYETECICEVFPEYYNEIRPNMDAISKEIAALRGAKDIAHVLGNSGEPLEAIEHYKERLGTLADYHGEALKRILTLVDFTRKREKERKKADLVRPLILGLLIAAVSAILGAVATRLLM